ncbi:porin [Bradyrhizobium sp. 160]|uniref:porin n=1 Tax=unclassified Bradyrhizobium TaxID=2631580 RepID=UPI001FFB95E4|nr:MULTISPECIES: porin [unclassified Bradyrhizobium]MCK1546953.1 porin [Bradyrhizobium sp. 179]MCK1621766.1 porin [Bradyrhizobium sp. 160]
MKFKGLLLGSAAALLAVGGAQAADLPVKAKAVEYVKICSLYGAGFYYIPGTDTCIKLGGYLRAEVALNTNADYSGQFTGSGGAHNRLSNYYTMRAREDLNIDTRTATEYGVVRTFFDAVFSWTSGGYTGAGTGLTGGATAYDAAPAGTVGNGSVSGGALGVYYAFIQFAGFTMGKAVSQFDAPWTGYPGNNFDALVGGGNTVTGVNQFTYTADFGQGITASFSAQDQSAYYQAGNINLGVPGTVLTAATGTGILGGAYGLNDIGGTRSPDLVAMVRVDQAWGLFQASVAAHDNHVGYYGASEVTGHPDDKWGWAAQLALSIKNIPTGAGDVINVQGVYTDGATRYNFQPTANPGTWSSFGSTGLAGAYQSIGFASAPDTVFVTGGQQESIKTWGVRGAYTHNWDPYWNSAIYGAYAQVKFPGGAAAAVCANFFALVATAAGTTCNPDFNIAQLGLITRWTPVKNLTFSADFNWTHLDQKYSGAVGVPLLATVAKPAATYELKDQDSFTLLLRAQRNW